jgi:hypothetical protein
MRPNDVDGAVVDAPRAMPSANAWMINPIVVAEERGFGGSEVGIGDAGTLGELERCDPRERSERSM